MDKHLYTLLSELEGTPDAKHAGGPQHYDLTTRDLGTMSLTVSVTIPLKTMQYAAEEGFVEATGTGPVVVLTLTDVGREVLQQEMQDKEDFTVDLRDYRGRRSMTMRCPDCKKVPALLYPASGGGSTFYLCTCGYVRRAPPTE